MLSSARAAPTKVPAGCALRTRCSDPLVCHAICSGDLRFLVAESGENLTADNQSKQPLASLINTPII